MIYTDDLFGWVASAVGRYRYLPLRAISNAEVR